MPPERPQLFVPAAPDSPANEVTSCGITFVVVPSPLGPSWPSPVTLLSLPVPPCARHAATTTTKHKLRMRAARAMHVPSQLPDDRRTPANEVVARPSRRLASHYSVMTSRSSAISRSTCRAIGTDT